MAASKGAIPWNKGTSKGWINGNGYCEIRIDGKIKKQHRHIMELEIGRPLSSDEDVHHINKIKTDNRIENLKIISHSEHTSLTNNRPYKKGYKLNLSIEERLRRADHMRKIKARGIDMTYHTLK